MKRFKYLTLAALVAVAACDEGTETVVTPPVTGTISGVVTIDGVGASGVTVTLSSGTTTSTDGSGAYSFSTVTAGAYTVTISGFASDASFTSTVQAATISTAGQVASVNFSGSYIRTSAIFGSVAAGGSGLSGASIALSGMSSGSTTTDSNGQFSFSGLRAGSYTVTLTNPDAATYSFASTSESVTLSVGAAEVVTFSGSLLETATIRGWLFLDENDKDDIFSSGLEDELTVAGVAITLEGGSVLDTMTVLTDATGLYEFTDLAPGTYRVTIDSDDDDLPIVDDDDGMLEYGMASESQISTLSVGEIDTVNWPFDIAVQRMDVSGFLGTDDDDPGITAIEDWEIRLYDTQANAAAGGATGRLGKVDTDASGTSVFRFDRDDDVSPNSDENDRIIFAQVAGAPTGTHVLNGETILEISYNAKDSMSVAPDTFDALYNSVVLKAKTEELDGDDAEDWIMQMTAEKDSSATGSTPALKSEMATDEDGYAFWTLTLASNMAQGSNGAFPDTTWILTNGTQAEAGGHGFKRAPTGEEGSVKGRWLRYIWDGAVEASDTVDVGTVVITYTDADIVVRVHHERDDSTDIPTYTVGDAPFSGLSTTPVELYEIDKDGDTVSVAGPTTPTVGTGIVTFANIDTEQDYMVRARSTSADRFVLNDTLINLTLDGADQTHTDKTLTGGAGNSTFAIKTNNNTVSGTILADDDTPAEDIIVTLAASSDNIQGSPTMVDTTDAAGAYAFADTVIEGPYRITISDQIVADEWESFDTLEVTSAPNSSGGADNDRADSGKRTVAGIGVTVTANFQPDRMDTEIHGVVVNDRDRDFNTLDPDEALSGVTINLYSDDDVEDPEDGIDEDDDVLIATTTTDPTGAYSFEDLREGDYIVEAESPSNATVLRELAADGQVINIALVTTEADKPTASWALNQNNSRQVGNTDPPAQFDEFPRWDYADGTADEDDCNLENGDTGPNCDDNELTTNPAHFIHLFNTGTVTGTVLDDSDDPAPNVRVTITRCQVSDGGTPSPPEEGQCDTKHGQPSPHIQNVDTDANGKYTFSNLLEGVYQIDIAPATGGYTFIDDPCCSESYLATIQENNDIETAPNFVVSN